MKRTLSRRKFVAVSAVGAATLLVPIRTARGNPGWNTEVNWMESEQAKRLFNEIRSAHPELDDTQVWEAVFSQLDPHNLLGYESGKIPLSISPVPPGAVSSLLLEAKSHIGYTPTSGSNMFNNWYGLEAQEPWCDVFVSYCAAHSGNGQSIGKFALYGNHISFFKRRGQWVERSNDVRPGDIIFFDWDHNSSPDHVGIVEWSDRTTTVGTIEGDTSNTVARRSYEMNDTRIMGYGRPAYTTESVFEGEINMEFIYRPNGQDIMC